MDIVWNLFMLALGFVLLVKGADWFVDGAAGIANKFKIPQLIIGLTIVAMGTSAPEAAVSISAALKGNAEITIGNIVGSNILNILIILGLTAVITPVAVAKSTIRVDIPFMLGITALLLVQGLDGSITLVDGIVLLAVFAGYLTYLIINARKNPEHLEGEEIKNKQAEITEKKKVTEETYNAKVELLRHQEAEKKKLEEQEAERKKILSSIQNKQIQIRKELEIQRKEQFYLL